MNTNTIKPMNAHAGIPNALRPLPTVFPLPRYSPRVALIIESTPAVSPTSYCPALKAGAISSAMMRLQMASGRAPSNP